MPLKTTLSRFFLSTLVAGGTFFSQWVNLMRGDTMLMSLVNHRYLATKPNEPGPVTATATGPSPARKGGACFKWKAVERNAAAQPENQSFRNRF